MRGAFHHLIHRAHVCIDKFNEIRVNFSRGCRLGGGSRPTETHDRIACTPVVVAVTFIRTPTPSQPLRRHIGIFLLDCRDRSRRSNDSHILHDASFVILILEERLNRDIQRIRILAIAFGANLCANFQFLFDISRVEKLTAFARRPVFDGWERIHLTELLRLALHELIVVAQAVRPLNIRSVFRGFEPLFVVLISFRIRLDPIRAEPKQNWWLVWIVWIHRRKARVVPALERLEFHRPVLPRPARRAVRQHIHRNLRHNVRQRETQRRSRHVHREIFIIPARHPRWCYTAIARRRRGVRAAHERGARHRRRKQRTAFMSSLVRAHHA